MSLHGVNIDELPNLREKYSLEERQCFHPILEIFDEDKMTAVKKMQALTADQRQRLQAYKEDVVLHMVQGITLKQTWAMYLQTGSEVQNAPSCADAALNVTSRSPLPSSLDIFTPPIPLPAVSSASPQVPIPATSTVPLSTISVPHPPKKRCCVIV